jgi:hypothetical protein
VLWLYTYPVSTDSGTSFASVSYDLESFAGGLGITRGDGMNHHETCPGLLRRRLDRHLYGVCLNSEQKNYFG